MAVRDQERRDSNEFVIQKSMQTIESSNLTVAERNELSAQLARAHADVRVEISNTRLGVWAQRPDPLRWSCAEIVEHILLVEASLLRRVMEHQNDVPVSDWKAALEGKKELLLKIVPSEGKVQASPGVATFRGINYSDVEAALSESRAQLQSFLQETADLPLKAILWPHSLFGSLSAYLWLLYIPLHTERHVAQLRRTCAAKRS